MTSPSRGDREDRRDRRRLEEERGVGAVDPGVDDASIASAADFVNATAPAGDGGGVDPGEALEGDPSSVTSSAPEGRAALGQERLERVAARASGARRRPRPQPEPARRRRGAIAARLERADGAPRARRRGGRRTARRARPRAMRDARLAEAAQDPVGRQDRQRLAVASRNSIRM